MLKITFPKYKISKFTPLDTPASGDGLSLGELFLSNAPSLPGGLLGSIFAGYVPLASPDPYPTIVQIASTVEEDI